MKKLLLSLVFIAATTGCYTGIKSVDPQPGIRCWIWYENGSVEGISCLPYRTVTGENP